MKSGVTTSDRMKRLALTIVLATVAALELGCSSKPVEPDIDELVPQELEPIESIDVSLTGLGSGQLPQLDLELGFGMDDFSLDTVLPEVDLTGSAVPDIGSVDIPTIQMDTSDIQSLTQEAIQP